MTLMDRFVRPGMRVQLVAGGRYRQSGGNYNHFDLDRGQLFDVSRVYNDNTVMVRTLSRLRNGHESPRHYSFRLHRDALDEYDPNGPAPRKLGQKPDGDEYIGVDHPGIQWLWEDLAQYAENQSWCSTYEELAAEVGIPGRKEYWEIELTVGDLTFVTEVSARSEEEARRLAREAVAQGVQD